MFTAKLLENNRPLLNCGFDLLESGAIQPDTYVIDMDILLENARLIKEKADSLNIALYYMTKQIGRNYCIARRLDALGYRGAVAVDWREALVLAENGARLGHIGHLVQIPERLLERLLKYAPEVMTVFSFEQAQQVNRAAARLGIRQKLLLKITECGDIVYLGQEGGIPLSLATSVAERINALENVMVEGITSFPCFLYNAASGHIGAVANMETLQAAASILRKNGVALQQINTPSATCVSSLPILAACGSTHGEPGHALTGTTPLHAASVQPERIALLYMTEVSHNVQQGSLCYGGGYYRRGNMQSALARDGAGWRAVAAGKVEDSAIDYYLPVQERLAAGTALAFCFRTQIFVTRSQVALVEGLAQGRPRLAGVFGAQGRQIS